MESRARVALSRVRTSRFRLIFHPWGREAGSEPVKALFLVSLEIFGIPDHAWHRAAAETLLAPFCKVEHLAPETRSLADMSVFRLSAWTINSDAIPRSSELLLPGDDAVELDADPDRAERLALGLARFPVRIHVASCVDYRRPPPPQAPPASDDGAARDSPPLPPRWPQHHQFPPASSGGSRRRNGRGGRRRGRRHAHVPPPCRGWEGILGPHPDAFPPADRVSTRLRLGSRSLLTSGGPRDAPSPAPEASPSDPVQTAGSQVPRDACISNRPAGAALSFPGPAGPPPAIPASQPGIDTTPPPDVGPSLRVPLGALDGPIRIPPPVADSTDAGDPSAANPSPSPRPLSPRGPDPEPTETPPRSVAASPSALSDRMHRADPEPVAGQSCMDMVLHAAPSGPVDDTSAPSPMQPMQTADVTAPDVDLSSFVEAISVRASSLLPAPKPRRRRKELPANFTPRRSFRIARVDQGLNSEMKAKRVLLCRLGLISSDDAPISDEVLGKYALLFEQPLALDVLQAFADFFGWQLPSSLPPTQGQLIVA
ncbi:hypothetical protein VPH35_036932 [Triticum aestivum]|uniref:DUF4283 domain-containing protein n=3 Tax=Aegilops tauschii subsp. strangulata TaxID=200361 RepID=A0A453BK75_AEGTS